MCVSSGYSLPLDAALHSAGVLDTGFFIYRSNSFSEWVNNLRPEDYSPV